MTGDKLQTSAGKLPISFCSPGRGASSQTTAAEEDDGSPCTGRGVRPSWGGGMRSRTLGPEQTVALLEEPWWKHSRWN